MKKHQVLFLDKDDEEDNNDMVDKEDQSIIDKEFGKVRN